MEVINSALDLRTLFLYPAGRDDGGAEEEAPPLCGWEPPEVHEDDFCCQYCNESYWQASYNDWTVKPAWDVATKTSGNQW